MLSSTGRERGSTRREGQHREREGQHRERGGALKLLLPSIAISGHAVESRDHLLSFRLLFGHHRPEFLQSLFHPDTLLLKGL